MAIRNILQVGDDTLTKKSRPVTAIDDRLLTLLDDMAETLQHAGGIGLAAPQVGILRRAAIIDVGDGVVELINPEIVEVSGSSTELEGCLSLPGKYGYVERPQKVTAAAQNRDGKRFTIIGEDLLARALCHEIEHLDGVLYTTHITEFAEPEDEES
jgi:peptide deformylase